MPAVVSRAGDSALRELVRQGRHIRLFGHLLHEPEDVTTGGGTPQGIHAILAGL